LTIYQFVLDFYYAYRISQPPLTFAGFNASKMPEKPGKALPAQVRRLMDGYAKFLEQADIFYQFTSSQLDLIADICQEQTYQNGETIFFEGSKTDELYVILQGEVDIILDPSLVSNREEDELQSVTVATLRRGQSFGEIALVDQGVRSATTRAAQNNTRLLIIPRQGIIDLCNSDPQLGYYLMRNLAADLALKIRNTDLRIRGGLFYTGLEK
jgi:CRP-like cAMP-binding protein